MLHERVEVSILRKFRERKLQQRISEENINLKVLEVFLQIRLGSLTQETRPVNKHEE